MMETKFTAAPWFTYPTVPDSEDQIFDWKTAITGPKHIGTLVQAGSRDLHEAEANARLIAAAPELLEALEKLLKIRSGRTVKAAKAAITKALGQ